MYEVASDTHRSRAAYARLQQQIVRGAEREQAILERVKTRVIFDKLAIPKNIRMTWDRGLYATLASTQSPLRVHPHALGQMCEVIRYNRTYLGQLSSLTQVDDDVRHAKVVSDLNWHLQNVVATDRKGVPVQRLCRTVGGELIGFVSRNFNRHLATAPLIHAFLTDCRNAKLAPIDGSASATQVKLQYALPYVFEPIDGEFVMLGVSFSNSDFADGPLKVSSFVRRIANGSSYVLDDSLCRVHLGPVVKESDIELSDDTLHSEVETQKKAMRDIISGQLQEESVQTLITVIRFAHQENIGWNQIKHELGKIMQKKELETINRLLAGDMEEGFEELPPVSFDEDNDPVANRWWVSSVVGQFAEKEQDLDRRQALEALAGAVLGRTEIAKTLKKAGPAVAGSATAAA